MSLSLGSAINCRLGNSHRHSKLLLILVAVGLLISPRALRAANTSTTTLAVSSAGSTVTSVASGSIVKLTASVIANGAPVTAGRVIFCDSVFSTFCSEIHKVGAAQLTSSGTAVLNFRPGAGTHNYTAQFLGTVTNSGSTSAAQTLSVTATNPTLTFLVAGTTGATSLTAIVSASGGSVAPTGNISLVDTSNQNLSLATSALTPVPAALGLASFSSPPTGTGPTDVAVADFNNDGIPDLAVANGGTTASPGAPLTILIGNGDGTFASGVSPTTSTTPSRVVTADFNGDGNADLAVDGGANHGVQILLGDGHGNFTAVPPFTSGGPVTMAVGDFNRDGNPDLAIVLSGSPNSVAVMLGKGDGNFIFTTPPPNTSGAFDLAVGDFDGDGFPDLAIRITGGTNPETLSIEINQQNGTFSQLVSYGLPSDNNITPPHSLVIADIDNDGKADIVASATLPDSANSSLSDFVLVSMLGTGDGHFGAPSVTRTADHTSIYAIATADFNGDGKADVAIVNDVETAIFISNGDGIFTEATTVAENPAINPANDVVTIGDFDGDGVPDLAQVNSNLNVASIYLTSRSTSSKVNFNSLTVPGTGTHNIEASYSGDSSFVGSTSTAVGVPASPISTALALTSSASSVAFGTPVVLTATLTPSQYLSLVTSGEPVTFTSGTSTLGTANLSSGAASLNVTSLPAGANNFTASYAGDSFFAAAASPSITVTVANPLPIAALAPSSLTFPSQTVGSTSVAQSITLTNTGAVPLVISGVAINGSFSQTNTCGTGVPSGQTCTFAVTFTPTADGAATGSLVISDNAAGSPQTVALSGTGASLSLTPSATSLTISAPGGSATSTIQLVGTNGFSGTVNLTCAVTFQGQGTASDPPTCLLNPAQAQVGSTAVSSTLTVSTTAASASAVPHFAWQSSGLTLATLLFFGLLPRRRWRGAVLFSLLGLAILGGMLSGCGGSSHNTTPTPPTNPGTTTGSYKVAVTATSGAITMSTTINLTVQ